MTSQLAEQAILPYHTAKTWRFITNFRFNDTTTAKQVNEIADTIQDFPCEIQCVTSAVVGKLVHSRSTSSKGTATSRERSRTSGLYGNERFVFTLQVEVELDDRDNLLMFTKHPAHLKLERLLSNKLVKVVAQD